MAKRRRAASTDGDAEPPVLPAPPSSRAAVARGWGMTAVLPRAGASSTGDPLWLTECMLQSPVTFSGVVSMCKALARRPGKGREAAKQQAQHMWDAPRSWTALPGLFMSGPRLIAGQMALAAAGTDLMSEMCGKVKPRVAARTHAATVLGGAVMSTDEIVGGVEAGWARLRALNAWIDKIFHFHGMSQEGRPRRPTYMQKLALRMFKEADCRMIFGAHLNRVLSRLRTEFDMDATHHYIALAAPRRNGKSEVICTYTLAGLLTFRNRKVLVTAKYKDQVLKLQQNLMKMVESMKGHIPGLVDIRNSETKGILSLVFSAKDVRTVRFAAITPALRGEGAHQIVTDEIAQVSVELLLNVQMPLLQQEGTSMVALSTVTGESNVFSKMMEIKHEGRPIFYTLQLETVCAQCKAAEFLGSVCPHNANKTPHFLDMSKTSMLQTVFAVLGNKEDYKAEIQGIIKSSQSIFVPAHVKELFEKPPFNLGTLTPNILQKHLFLAVDPCGCGSASDMAAVAAYCTPLEHVVRRVFMCVCALWGLHDAFRGGGGARVAGAELGEEVQPGVDDVLPERVELRVLDGARVGALLVDVLQGGAEGAPFDGARHGVDGVLGQPHLHVAPPGVGPGLDPPRAHEGVRLGPPGRLGVEVLDRRGHALGAAHEPEQHPHHGVRVDPARPRGLPRQVRLPPHDVCHGEQRGELGAGPCHGQALRLQHRVQHVAQHRLVLVHQHDAPKGGLQVRPRVRLHPPRKVLHRGRQRPRHHGEHRPPPHVFQRRRLPRRRPDVHFERLQQVHAQRGRSARQHASKRCPCPPPVACPHTPNALV